MRALRHRRPGRSALVVALVVLTVAVGTALGLTRLSTDTGPESFLPAGDPTLSTMRDAASAFGGDPIVVLLESDQPRALLEPARLNGLLRLEGQLAGVPDVSAVYGPATVLNQVSRSAKNMMAGLSGRRDSVRIQAEAPLKAAGRPEAAIRAAGDAAALEFDRRYAALLVQALPAGLPTLANPGFVNRVVFGDGDEPQPQWQFVVPSKYAVAVLVRPRENLDQTGTERLVETVRTAAEQSGINPTRLTVSGSPALAAALGDQVRREILLLGGLAIGLIVLCYQFAPWHHRRRHRLLPVVATLCATALVLAGFGWIGRPLSLGVVAFLPILIGIGSDFPAYLVQRAQRRRILVAAAASAAGFASLAVSPLPFVRDLGLALAAGVLVAVAVALGLRRLLPTDPEPGPDAGVDGVPSASPGSRRLPGPAQRVGLLVLAVLIAAGGWVGLSVIRVEANPERLAAGLPAVTDIQHVEEVINTSGEVQVLLSGPNVTTTAALDWQRRAEEAIVLKRGDALRPVVSVPGLLRFLGPSPTQEQIDAGLDMVPEYLVGAVISGDNRRAVLSFGLKLQDLDQQRQLIDELRAALPPAPDGYRVEVGGLPVAAVRGYELVSRDSYLSNALGIVAAGMVLLIGLPRRRDSLRAILAAALATGWGLAGVYLLGVPLTPLTVALGSLTTVTACEFTVLLTDRHGEAGSRLGRTVAVAALAAALGYLALSASGLVVIREFGLLLAGSVGLSFLAAHTVVRLLPDRPEPTSGPARRPGATRTEVGV